MKRLVFSLIAIVAFAAGCHAQVPPATAHAVALTWTAPAAAGNWAGCSTSAPCTYAVYRCAAGAACTSTSNTGWTEITSSATRPTGTTYTDTTAVGLTANYVVETEQGGSNSAPSNVVTVSVPGSPLAPSLSTPTTAENELPTLIKPALPEVAALPEGAGRIHLVARVTGL